METTSTTNNSLNQGHSYPEADGIPMCHLASLSSLITWSLKACAKCQDNYEFSVEYF